LLTYGFFIPLRGSVFTPSQICTVIATGGVSVLMGYFSCNSNRTNNCFPVPDPSPSLLTLSSLCGFLLAIFTSILLSRWWAMRGHFCSLEGAAADIVMQVMAMSLGTIRSSKLIEERKRIFKKCDVLLRKICGLALLITMTLFKKQKPKLERLRTQGYVTEAEYSRLLEMKATPVNCCFIIGTLLQQAANEGLLGDGGNKTASFAVLLKDLSEIRQNCTELDKCVSCQIPYPMVQMIAIVVYGFLAQLIYVSAGFIAADMKITGLLTICISSFVLMGALKMFDIISDPFRNDPADFPGNYYCDKFEDQLVEMRNNFLTLAMLSSEFCLEDTEKSREIDALFKEYIRNSSLVVPFPCPDSLK